jgi:hypothetical protein
LSGEAQATTYLSTISGVREVALRGAADLAFWRAQLQAAQLEPYDEQGRASLLLTAIDARFRGIPFRELSIAVLVGDGQAGYLAHAFNSSRLLAWAERVFFQTPYHLADLAVNERPPAGFSVSANGQTLMSARLRANAPAARQGDELWEGTLYLPGGQKLYRARLSGPATLYTGDPVDTLTIQPPSGDNILRQLVESGFEGREWLVRPAGAHARSRTFRRERSRARYDDGFSAP